MNVYGLLVHERLESFRGVLLCRIDEVSTAHGFLHAVPVLTTGLDRQTISLHDRAELLAHILRSSHLSCLYEILKAPALREFRRAPCLIHRQQRQMVSFGGEKFGALLIGGGLLLLGSMEYSLYAEHGHDGENL